VQVDFLSIGYDQPGFKTGFKNRKKSAFAGADFRAKRIGWA
jgi:hypothetical protein